MADNVQLPGTGQVVATKEIGGIEYQIMLLADGTYAIVNPATADKQDLLLTELQKKADLTETQPVSAASLPLPSGAATSAKQLADNHNVTVSNQPAGLATSAKQLPDGHEVEVNNLPTEYPLPTAQVTTLTPPAAITGFATSAKQLADGHNVAVSNQITGYATSAKQLADGHNVAVSNMIPAVETGLATSVKQLPDKHGVKLVDTAGDSQGILMENGCPTVRDYFVGVAEGDIPNHKRWDKFGYNGDIDNVEEDIISQGGTYIFPALTGIQMDIVSTSANDDGSPVGTGVRTVSLHYLDETGTEHIEDITMNGTVPVATTALKISRINYLIAKTIGNLGVAAGTIMLSEHGGTSRNYAQITVGYTKSRQCIYTVPTGKTLFINSMVVSGVNTSAGHWVRFTLRTTYDEEELAIRDFFLPFAETMMVDQSFFRQFITPLRFPSGIDIKMTAVSDAAASNELCSCALRGWLES